MGNGDIIVKLTSMTLFFIEGLLGLITAIIFGTFDSMIMYPAYFVVWIGLLIFMGKLPVKTDKQVRIYILTNVVLVSIFAIIVSHTANTQFAFMSFQLMLWTCNIPGLRKNVFILLGGINVVMAGVMTFGANIFSPLDFVMLSITIFISCWVSMIFIDRTSKLLGRIKEQNQSYDDMIALVENRFMEEKGANIAKSAFLANMSHEIRTPINAILGFNTMTMRESKETQIVEYAKEIEKAGNTLLSLVNDILDISKVESGKMEIIPVEYGIADMVDDVTTMMAIKAQAKGLELKIEVDENIPSKLYGDDVRIKQVLINILNNAVKYTEKGSVTLKLDGDVSGNVVMLKFSVIDTGIGIREEDMDKLFAKFERLDTVKNRNVEGTGLGMSITSKLLALMHSNLDVQSVYGEGSTFSFYLVQGIVDKNPIGKIEDKNKTEAVTVEEDVKYIVPNAQILVVDDNKTNRMVFTRLLRRLKPQVDEADGGEKALKCSKEKKYDIIFLDHMMPGMDGIETLHNMRNDEENLNAGVPVVALTANAIAGSKEYYLSEGFDDYLSKPIDPDALEKMILTKISKDKIEIDTDTDVE